MNSNKIDSIAAALLDIPAEDRAKFIDSVYSDEPEVKEALNSLMSELDAEDDEDLEDDIEEAADNAKADIEDIEAKGEAEGNEVNSVESVDQDGDGDADVTITEQRDDNDDTPNDTDNASKGNLKSVDDIVDTLSSFRF